MLNDFKKLTRKKAIIRFIVGMLLSAFMIVIFGADFIKFFKGPADLYDLSLEELPDAYVTGDIYALIDNFAQNYTENNDGTEDITENYYIVPVDDEEYIALEVGEDKLDLSARICDETYEYLTGTRTELTTAITVSGTVLKMDKDLYDYYLDWFKTSGYLKNPTQEDIYRLALPYVLRINYVGDMEKSTLYFSMGVTAVLLLFSIITLVKMLTGMYLSPIKKYMMENAYFYPMEQIDADYRNAKEVKGVRIGEGWTFFISGGKARIIKNSDIVWAYMEEVTHRLNGIRCGVTKAMVIYDKNKKKYTLPMKRSDDVHALLRIYHDTQPHIVLGYGESLWKCFRKDFEAFLNISKNRSTAAEEGDKVIYP